MESAFTYLASLVDAFEDVGKGNGNKRNQPAPSVWDQAAMPSCGVVTDCADDFDTRSLGVGLDEMEMQQNGQHPRSATFDDEEDDRRINQSASNKSGRRSAPSYGEKRPFSDILKSKSSDIASSILQSFSGGSSNHPDLTKSYSSHSKTTNETYSDGETRHDDSEFGTSNSLLMSQSGSTRTSNRHRRKHLPPPPSNLHIQWFAHGILWTCLAIGSGWLGFGLSYGARQSADFVQLKQPMYLDPRYETIPSVGMLQFELCFNDTHLDILEELADDDYYSDNIFYLGGELEPQPRTQIYDIDSANSHNYNRVNDFAGDNFGPSIVETTTTPCIFHKVTSDDVDDDAMYTLSRCMAFLSMFMGGFVTICLTFSVFWKSINLRPIGLGYLLAYFMQSFTLLIFDSNLCKDHFGCSLSGGGICSVIASVCWIISCAACARMDKRKFKDAQEEQARYEEERKHRKYYSHRRQSERHIHSQAHPRQIVIENDVQENDVPGPSYRQNRERRPDPEEQQTAKPKSIADQNRASTAETAQITSDDESAQDSEDHHEILQDVSDMNEDPDEINNDPVCIPVLPLTPPSSERSMEKKSEKPPSTSSQSKQEENNNTHVEDEKREKPKKPRSKKKKSKSKEDDKKNKKPRSRKSKSKGEILENQEVEEQTSSQLRTQKPNSSKRTKEGKKRPSSPIQTRNIDMAGDIKEVDSGDKNKNSPRKSNRTIADIASDHHATSSTARSMSSLPSNTDGIEFEQQQRPQSATDVSSREGVPKKSGKAKKRSSSRPRRLKSNAMTGDVPLRASVRKAIKEGKHYEL